MKMTIINERCHIDKYAMVLMVIFIFFAIFKLYNALTAGLMYDEPETLYNAKQFYQGKLPFVDYFEHHPIVSYILLAPFSDISVWEYQRILMSILSIISAIVLYIFLSDIFNKKISILCSISFLVSPLLNRMSIMIIPDSFMIFFFIIGLYFYGRILKNSSLNNYTNFFLLGLFWSLSILSKIGSIIPITIFTLFIMYRFKTWKNILYLSIGYIVPIGIIFIIYRLNTGYIYLMIDGIMSNVYVRQYISQSFSDRIDILTNQIISMYIYLWIAAIIGSIYYLKIFLGDKSKVFKNKLKEDKYMIILSSAISLLLLIYYNLTITVDSWPHYYMIGDVLLVIISIGFYVLIQKYWHIIYDHKMLLTTISIILIFFGLIQPFMMSTYPFQPNNHKEEQLLTEWLSGGDNIDKNKYVFENWIYFNYLANLESDYKVPVLSDVTFKYLTSTNNRFADNIPLGKNVYENSDYDTVIFHEPMFDDIFIWMDMQFDKDSWYLTKRYNMVMNNYNNGQILFWYPGFKTDTFDFQINIWKRRSLSSILMEKSRIQGNIPKENIEKFISLRDDPSSLLSFSDEERYESGFIYDAKDDDIILISSRKDYSI